MDSVRLEAKGTEHEDFTLESCSPQGWVFTFLMVLYIESGIEQLSK